MGDCHGRFGMHQLGSRAVVYMLSWFLLVCHRNIIRILPYNHSVAFWQSGSTDYLDLGLFGGTERDVLWETGGQEW